MHIVLLGNAQEYFYLSVPKPHSAMVATLLVTMTLTVTVYVSYALLKFKILMLTT